MYGRKSGFRRRRSVSRHGRKSSVARKRKAYSKSRSKKGYGTRKRLYKRRRASSLRKHASKKPYYLKHGIPPVPIVYTQIRQGIVGTQQPASISLCGGKTDLHCLSATDLENIAGTLTVISSNVQNSSIFITSSKVTITLTNRWNMPCEVWLHVLAPRNNLMKGAMATGFTDPETMIVNDINNLTGTVSPYTYLSMPPGLDIFNDCPTFTRAWKVLKSKKYNFEAGADSRTYTYKRKNYREKVNINMASNGTTIAAQYDWYKYFSRVFLLVVKGMPTRDSTPQTQIGQADIIWNSTERYEYVMLAAPTAHNMVITNNLPVGVLGQTTIPEANPAASVTSVRIA